MTLAIDLRVEHIGLGETHDPPRLEKTMNLGPSPSQVEVMKHGRAYDGIEGAFHCAILEVLLEETYTLQSAFPGDSQQLCGEIDSRDVGSGLREHLRKKTRAASDLKCPGIRTEFGPLLDEIGASACAYAAGRRSPPPGYLRGAGREVLAVCNFIFKADRILRTHVFNYNFDFVNLTSRGVALLTCIRCDSAGTR